MLGLAHSGCNIFLWPEINFFFKFKLTRNVKTKFTLVYPERSRDLS